MENEVLEEKNTDEVTINQDNDEKKKTPKTPKQKVFFGLKIAGNVIFYAAIIALFLFSIMNIRGGNGTNGFPNLFGKGMLTVSSNSMSHYNYDAQGNKTTEKENLWTEYKVGGFTTEDLLFADVFNDKDASNLKVGDVITFYQENIDGNGKKGLNTHRIVAIANNKTAVITEGDAQYYTRPYQVILDSDSDAVKQQKANYNYILENERPSVIQTVNVSNIRGVVTGVSYGAGGVLKNIQANWIWYFVVPVGILLAVELFLVIRNILAYRNEKNGKPSNLTEEEKEKLRQEEKERLRQELLAELRAQGLAPKEEIATEPKVVESDTPVEDNTSTLDEIEEKQEVETTEDISEDKQ